MKGLWIETRKRLMVLKRYAIHSIVVGFLAAVVSTLWIAVNAVLQGAVQGPNWIRSYLIYWALWSFVMSFVLPAILSDDFIS